MTEKSKSENSKSGKSGKTRAKSAPLLATTDQIISAPAAVASTPVTPEKPTPPNGGSAPAAKAPAAKASSAPAKAPSASASSAKAPSASAQPAQASSKPAPAPQAEGKSSGEKKSSIDPSEFIVKNPETYMTNIAKAIEQAGKAASAWLEPREKGEKSVTTGPEITEMTDTLSKVTGYWMSDPSRALAAQTHLFSSYLDLWNASVRRIAGEEVKDVIQPEIGDKRFKDDAWDRVDVFSFLKQAYLLTAKWADEMVEQTEGLDDRTRHKASFYMQQLTNALSPSNFPATNPEVLRETAKGDGENLVKGMQMLVEDIKAGGGDLRLRQTDTSKYKLGVDMANTPGKVVFENDVCQILQYEATTKKVLKRPLLIVPPWINKFYILDLNEKKSFIRWCVNQGHTVFVISWINPKEKQAGKSFQHYAREGIIKGLDVIENITGENEVNMIGYCVGGTLLSATLALMAAEGDTRSASATFFTTQIDFTYAGDLLVFVDEKQISAVEQSMQTKGYLEGARMANAFNLLRSRDLIWPYVVNNYMRGKDPLPFDLLYWNSDSTRMPAANHSFYLRNCYLENNLSQGKMKLGDVPIDLKKVTIPVYNLATKEDHIAPAKSAFLGTQFLGGPVEFVLTGSGHIAGVVNPPADENGGGKYQFWTGGPNVGAFEEWFEQATETPGSWWVHWHQWIKSHDDKMVKAREIGSAEYTAIEDAPGSYVMEKA